MMDETVADREATIVANYKSLMQIQNNPSPKSFHRLVGDNFVNDFNGLKQTVNAIIDHPIQTYINTEKSLLKNTFNFFFCPQKFAQGLVRPTIDTIKEFAQGDSNTRTIIGARLAASTTENVLLTLVGLPAARLAKIGGIFDIGAVTAEIKEVGLVGVERLLTPAAVSKGFTTIKSLRTVR